MKKRIISFMFAALLFLTSCNKSDSVREHISENVSESIVQTKDDIILQLESSHFKFYSKEQDKQPLEDLSNALEENYTRVTNDLQTSLTEKVDVYIYSDLDTYHKEINMPDAPAWAIGNSIPNENTIQMVNPLNSDAWSYSDFMKTIVHEFTHVVVSNMNSDIYELPIWLSEGIAVYEARQNDGNLEAITANLGKTPIYDLETDYVTFGDNNGYQISYYIIEYMIKEYGYDKLIDFIKDPSSAEVIFGLSKDAFQQDWIDYMINYE